MKVLVGCPTSQYKFYCFKRYTDAVKNLTYQNYDILLVDNSKTEHYFNKIKKKLPVIRGNYFESARERIVDSRNILREHVLKNKYDYFLSLEQDVIPPRNVIERLLNYKKEIVSGVYFVHNDENALVPLLYKKVRKGEVRNLTNEEIEEPALIKVDACGLGCVLISRDVLKKIKFRYDKNEAAFDDMWFSLDAYKNGFKIYADTSVKCLHLVKGRWPWADIKK